MFKTLKNWWQGERLPTVTQFNEMEYVTRYTPDVAVLENKQFLPVLEYGDAQREHPLYQAIAEYSVFQAVAFTLDPGYIMYVKDQESPYAVALKSKRKPVVTRKGSTGRIRGELHLVEAEGVMNLDIARQNGVRFKRITVPVDIPHREILKITDPKTGLYQVKETGTQHYKSINAYMYVGVDDHWVPQLDGGYNFPYANYEEPAGKKPVPFYHWNNAKKTE